MINKIKNWFRKPITDKSRLIEYKIRKLVRKELPRGSIINIEA